jgi:hypothetical protein
MKRAHYPLPVVGQRRPTLPDGGLDPQADTDCGEACCSIALLAFGFPFFSPGCIREVIGGPNRAGWTTADDLADFLECFRVDTAVEQWTPDELPAELRRVASTGGVAIVLGTWIFPDLEHWMVSGRAGDAGVWFSDPWAPGRREESWVGVAANYGGTAVVVHGR